MKTRTVVIMLLVGMMLLILALCSKPAESAPQHFTSTPSVTRALTKTLTKTPSPSRTPTLTSSSTPTNTSTPTPTRTPTSTSTSTSTTTASQTASPTASSTPTKTPTPISTLSPTPSPTNTPTLFTLTVNLTGNGSGFVYADPPGAYLPGVITYPANTNVSMHATAETGYFAGWSGDVYSLDNPMIITMDGNKTITATFTILDPPDLSQSTKVVNRDVVYGRTTLWYTITLTNTGGVTVSFVMDDPIPPGTEYVRGSTIGGCSYDIESDLITWIGEIPSMNAFQCVYAVDVYIIEFRYIWNNAHVVYDGKAHDFSVSTLVLPRLPKNKFIYFPIVVR